MHSMQPLYDLDHVMLTNGKIYRVLGNFQHQDYFWGYNVYSSDPLGERVYQGKKYRKNFLEDERLPLDVLETYAIVSRHEIAMHLDPVQTAQQTSASFRGTIWFALYGMLKTLCGEQAVGIFGSSMFGLHLTPDGQVRKDIDFVIEGLENIERLQHAFPDIRRQLGFREVSETRQLQQYQRYQKVFQNQHNTLREIIKRRWSGLQLSEQIVSTIRSREKRLVLPFELVHQAIMLQKDVVLAGKVREAAKSNLFPRMFTLETAHGNYPVSIL